MRIAIWHNLPSGGGKRALYDHVRGLVARGHYVEAWCPDTADRSYLPLGDLITENILPLVRPGRTNMDRRLQVPATVAPQLAAMESHCAAAAAAISQGDFDLLVAHPCTFFRTSPIARHMDIPSVLYLQEPYRWLYEALPRLPWVAPDASVLPRFGKAWVRERAMEWRVLQNARIQAREERRNAAAFGRILVNSSFSREGVLRAYGLDSTVCYLGTDVGRFSDLGLERERMVIGIGAFSREKNIGLVVEALGRLRGDPPKLVWIGNVAELGLVEELSARAAALGVPFEARQRIPDSEVIELLNRASAMVYAPRLEPFGLAPIEAGACGLPVVAVAEGGMRETVVDGVTGFLVRHDAGDMALAVQRLLDDPALARRLGSNGRSRAVEFWSTDAATDRLEASLREVVPAERL